MSKKIKPLLNITPEIYPNIVRSYDGLIYDGVGNLIPIISNNIINREGATGPTGPQGFQGVNGIIGIDGATGPGIPGTLN